MYRNSKLLKKVALRLKELREGQALTQEDVYNDTNIHVGRIEQGFNDPSVSTLERLCNYFGISIEEFFTGVHQTRKTKLHSKEPVLAGHTKKHRGKKSKPRKRLRR